MAIRDCNQFQAFVPPVGINGEAEICPLVSKEELFGHGRAYGRAIFRPGTALNWHKHVNEVEYYYIVRGTATFINHERQEELAGPGQLCFMNPNEGHAIRNDGDEDLEIIMLILNVDP